MKVKTIYIKDKPKDLKDCPNFSITGSVAGMRKIYGQNCLLVKCGSWIYNVSSKPKYYYNLAH